MLHATFCLEVFFFFLLSKSSARNTYRGKGTNLQNYKIKDDNFEGV